MFLNFPWPGDVDHDELNALFAKYAKLEMEFLLEALWADPRQAVLEGED